MKRLKTLALFSAVILSLSMTACGEDETSASSTEKSSSVSDTEISEYEYSSAEIDASVGQTMTWGNYSFFVPDGMTLKGGDTFDENDPRYFSIQKSSLSTYDFKTEDSEENMMNTYNYNKKTYTNGQFDVEAEYGGIKWTGFQYDGFGTPGFEAYTTIDGVYLRVSCTFHAFDNDIAKAILGSIKINAEGSTAETATEASAAETTTEAATEATTEAPADTVEIAQTIEMKTGKVGIPKGYTVMKDAAPSQYVMKNDETGGKVSYCCGSSTADEDIDKAINTVGDAQKQTWNINGKDWVGYTPYDNCYSLAADGKDGYIRIDIDYGTMEEIEKLISCIEFTE